MGVPNVASMLLLISGVFLRATVLILCVPTTLCGCTLTLRVCLLVFKII